MLACRGVGAGSCPLNLAELPGGHALGGRQRSTEALMLGVNRNPSRPDVRTFGLVILLGFAVIGALLWYKAVKPPGGWWPEAGWGWNGAVLQVIAVALLAFAVWIALECFVFLGRQTPGACSGNRSHFGLPVLAPDKDFRR